MTDIVEHSANTPSRPGFSAAEYNAVAVGSSLQAINLLSSRFDVNAECLGDNENWNLSYGRKVLSCTVDLKNRYVAAIFRYEVTAKVGRKRAMVCKADYGIYYTIPDDSTEEAALGFCRNVGSYAAYPYFRTLVAQLTWNAGVNLPPLPAIASTAHIPKKPKKTDGASEGES